MDGGESVSTPPPRVRQVEVEHHHYGRPGKVSGSMRTIGNIGACDSF